MKRNRMGLVVFAALLLMGILMTSLAVSESSLNSAGNSPKSEVASATAFIAPPQPGRILLVEDSVQQDGRRALDSFGYNYTNVTPSQFATVNLNNYNIIYVAWLPSQQEIAALNARKGDLENWINNGGGIVVNAEWKIFGVTNPYSFLPVRYNTTDNPSPYSDKVQIIDPGHPLVAGLNDSLLSNWSSAVHGEMNVYPPEASIIAKAAITGYPAITGMCYGAGKIVVTSMDPEFHLLLGKSGASILFSNELEWASKPCGSRPAVSYTDMWFKSNTTVARTSSTTFVNIPATAVTVDLLYPSDLEIMFSSEAMTSSNATVYVRALVDGREAAPGQVQLISRQGRWQSHGFDFYRLSLPAGRHTVQMQWRVNLPKPEFGQLGKRTLIVTANGAGS